MKSVWDRIGSLEMCTVIFDYKLSGKHTAVHLLCLKALPLRSLRLSSDIMTLPNFHHIPSSHQGFYLQTTPSTRGFSWAQSNFKARFSSRSDHLFIGSLVLRVNGQLPPWKKRQENCIHEKKSEECWQMREDFHFSFQQPLVFSESLERNLVSENFTVP